MIKYVYLLQQDLQIRGSGGGGAVIQTLRKGGGGPSLKKNCFQPKNKGGGLAPPLLFVSGICSAPLVLVL